MPDTSQISLRANSLIVSVGAGARLIVSLISIPLLVRFLGLERYGVWVVLNSVIAIAGLMELGLGMALTNFVSADYARKDWVSANRDLCTSFILVTCLGVFTSIGLWIAHPILGQALFAEDSYRVEALLSLGVISWLLILRFWQQWAMAAEASLLRYDIQSVIETATAIIMQIGILLLALAGSSLWVLAAWSLVVTGGSLIAHYLFLKYLFAGHFLRPGYSKQTANVLLRFGATQWLSSLGSSLFGYADRIIVNLILGSAAAGLYSAATSISIQINNLSAIPFRVLPPTISAAKALAQDSRIRQVFVRATKLNGLFVLLITAPIFFWTPQISYLLVGIEHITMTTNLLRILALAYGLYSLAAASFFMAIGVGFPIFNARWGVGGALFSLFLMVFFASSGGLVGAAWGNIGYILMLIVNFQVIKVIGLKYSSYLKLFLPSVAMIVLWWLLTEYVDIVSLPIWVKILTFGIFVIISSFCIYGLDLIKDLLELTMEVYKKYMLRNQTNV